MGKHQHDSSSAEHPHPASRLRLDWKREVRPAAILMLAAAALVWDAYGDFAAVRETLTWPAVQARIVHTGVVPYQRPFFSRTTSSRPEDIPRYQATVEYEYRVGDEVWTSDQVWIRGGPPLFSNCDEAIAFQDERFPDGKEVPAFVDPADPSRAVLLRGSQFQGEVAGLLAMTFVAGLMGALMVFALVHPRWS